MSSTRRWSQRQRTLLSVALRRRRPRPFRLRLVLLALLVVCAVTAGMLIVAQRNVVGEAPPALRMLEPSEPGSFAAAAFVQPEPFAAEPLPLPERPTAPTTTLTPTAPFIEQAETLPVMFNGKAVRPVKTIRMRVTGYCSCSRCCGRHADGKTASGYPVWINGGKLVAADTNLLPFGTLVSIPGYAGDKPVPVLDRGGKIKGYRLDLYFPSHKQARQWGIRYLDVMVWERVGE